MGDVAAAHTSPSSSWSKIDGEARIRLGRQHEGACKRTYAHGGRSYRHVENILKHGLDRAVDDESEVQTITTEPHINVRGPDYYKEN